MGKKKARLIAKRRNINKKKLEYNKYVIELIKLGYNPKVLSIKDDKNSNILRRLLPLVARNRDEDDPWTKPTPIMFDPYEVRFKKSNDRIKKKRIKAVEEYVGKGISGKERIK